jgi:hypothetical protein
LIAILYAGQFDRQRTAAAAALLNAIAVPSTLSSDLQIAVFQQAFGGIRM